QRVLAVPDDVDHALLRQEEPERRALVVVERAEEMAEGPVDEVQREIRLVQPERFVVQVAGRSQDDPDRDDRPGEIGPVDDAEGAPARLLVAARWPRVRLRRSEGRGRSRLHLLMMKTTADPRALPQRTYSIGEELGPYEPRLSRRKTRPRIDTCG